MVFYKFGAGFASGVLIATNCHQYVYAIIANSFVRPHWQYQMNKKKYLTKDHAVSLDLLDSYVKDTFFSFFTFWIVIGPCIYEAYFKKDVAMYDEEDKFATQLNRMNDIQHASMERKRQEALKEKGESEGEEEKSESK